MLVTDLVNVRYLTGFTGTNGACVCGPGVRLFLTDFRYTERAAAEVEGWEAVTRRRRLAGRDRRAPRGPGRLRGRPHVGAPAGETEGETRRGGRAGRRRRQGREAAPGQGRGASWRRSPRPRSSPTRSGAGALERGLAGRTRARGRPRRRSADPRARRRALLPGDRRRRPQRGPAARRAGRARDRPRRAGRLRHGRAARRLLLRRHPHLRHRRARRGGAGGLRGRPPGAGRRRSRRSAPASTARTSTAPPAR